MEEKKCGKKVPQLGEQEVQSIAPLIVPSDKAALNNDNIFAQQINGDTGYAIAEVAYKYVSGEPLVKDPNALTTHLWKLHNWYRTAAKRREILFHGGS